MDPPGEIVVRGQVNLTGEIQIMKATEDPDFADPSAIKVGPLKVQGRGSPSLVLGWMSVYALNLIVPLMWGWPMAGPTGQVGIILAILLLLTSGCLACLRSRKAGIVLFVGGGLFASTQFAPTHYIVVGSFAVSVARTISGSQGPDGLNLTGGLIASLITGVIMIALAIVIGFLVARFWSIETRSNSDARK